MSFIRQILLCLKSPRSSFKSILEKPSLSRAAALILVIAVVAAWASYNYAAKLPLTIMPERERRLFPGAGGLVSLEQLRQTLMISSAITGLIGVFASWSISSALIHAFSRVQRGKGSFRSMLTLAGYALTPLLIQHLLRLIDSFITTGDEVLRPTKIQIFTQPLLSAMANTTINYFSIFRLWSIALFVIALSENYKISTVRSVVTVAATYILMIFLSIFLPL